MAEATKIAEAVAGVREYFAGNPDEARSTDTEARAVLVDGLRVRVEGPNDWSVETDMATAVGGGGSAPSPGWLLRAATASCDAVLIAMQAAEEGVALNHLEARVTSESDDRGLIGGGADVPAGPLNVLLEVRLGADGVERGELEALVHRALRRSPVSDALAREVPIEVRVEKLA